MCDVRKDRRESKICVGASRTERWQPDCVLYRKRKTPNTVSTPVPARSVSTLHCAVCPRMLPPVALVNHKIHVTVFKNSKCRFTTRLHINPRMSAKHTGTCQSNICDILISVKFKMDNERLIEKASLTSRVELFHCTCHHRAFQCNRYMHVKFKY